MKTFGIIFGYISLLIVVILGFFVIRKTTGFGDNEQSQTSQNAISKSYDAKVQTDLKTIETGLVMYFNTKNQYPKTYSFSQMSRELIQNSLLPSELEEPNSNYQYKYCSSDGKQFLLEATSENQNIVSFGQAQCTTGE